MGQWHRSGWTWIDSSPILLLLFVFVVLTLTGCASPQCPNEPLAGDRDPAHGYRFENLDVGAGNTDDVFVCLTFSGGGTRAGAMAYGVLTGLRDAALPLGDQSARGEFEGPGSLLDEVDLISSVSGGSFVAMYYALFRDRTFDEEFKDAFLYRNIQRDLMVATFNPANLVRLPFIGLDRIDLAADLYSDTIFESHTFGDLISSPGTRPFVVVNATNMATGRRFEFTQGDFDLLGSDMNTMPCGWATAASSAFPFLLSPLRLQYHAGAAADTAIMDILNDPSADERRRRRYHWARMIARSPEAPASSTDEGEAPLGAWQAHELDSEQHRFLYLLDGGISDNLGLDYVINAYRNGPIAHLIDQGRIKRLVVIVVDAGNQLPSQIERGQAAPGLFVVGYKTATIGIDNHTEVRIDLLQSLLQSAPRTRDQVLSYAAALREHVPEVPDPTLPGWARVEPYVVHVSLNDVTDEDLRERLLRMPTRFTLPKPDVDLIIETSRDLLLRDEEFVRLLRDLALESGHPESGLPVAGTNVGR
ncbi:MAG: patatin-like phospholipase family protein [Planctomycetes bacterium]|nr:patatin-like phospholipase family protein [Planctomycetota bacterium]NOG54979.1 hypothetical protein [Planctomycetota bacterium]